MQELRKKFWEFPSRNQERLSLISEAAIYDECRGWVDQMVLPIIPERKTKGAIAYVAERTGLAFSKIKKLKYGEPCSIKAYERERLKQARARFIEAKIQSNLEEARRLREEYDLMERHGELPLG